METRGGVDGHLPEVMRIRGEVDVEVDAAARIADEPALLLYDVDLDDTLADFAPPTVRGVLLLRRIVLVQPEGAQQPFAARALAADFKPAVLLGELVEFGQTEQVFTNPRDKRTEDYVTGRYG